MKKKILLSITIIVGIIDMLLLLYIKNQRKLVKESNEKVFKFKKYYQLYNQWIKSKTEDFSFETVLLSSGYSNIAIYGNGEIGCRLYDELKGTKVKVSCFIDKKANDITLYSEDNISVFGIDETDKYGNVDAIIITPVNIYDEINEQLMEKNINSDIVSIEEIVFQ